MRGVVYCLVLWGCIILGAFTICQSRSLPDETRQLMPVLQQRIANFKRSLAVPQRQQLVGGKPICADFIFQIWNMMTLNEDRNMLKEDMERFLLMTEGREGFKDLWQACTFMYDDDTNQIFNFIAGLPANSTEPANLTTADTSNFWQKFHPVTDHDDNERISYNNFVREWHEILSDLPHGGCQQEDKWLPNGLCVRYMGGGF